MARGALLGTGFPSPTDKEMDIIDAPIKEGAEVHNNLSHLKSTRLYSTFRLNDSEEFIVSLVSFHSCEEPTMLKQKSFGDSSSKLYSRTVASANWRTSCNVINSPTWGIRQLDAFKPMRKMDFHIKTLGRQSQMLVCSRDLTQSFICMYILGSLPFFTVFA